MSNGEDDYPHHGSGRRSSVVDWLTAVVILVIIIAVGYRLCRPEVPGPGPSPTPTASPVVEDDHPCWRKPWPEHCEPEPEPEPVDRCAGTPCRGLAGHLSEYSHDAAVLRCVLEDPRDLDAFCARTLRRAERAAYRERIAGLP